MAWSVSQVFRQILGELLAANAQTGFGGLDADTLKIVLYDNGITPDNDCTLAQSGYAGTGVWTATGGGTGTNQVYQAGQWAQGGVALASQVIAPPGGTPVADKVFLDGADTASGSAATLSNIYGTFCYDDTVTAPTADIGICYNYLGGANSVTNGTFTVVWNANGLFRFAL
jgi:hypothetical protein